MPKRFYIWTRDLHLYLGLFISPFVLLFAVSVFFLNHARMPLAAATPDKVITYNLQIPSGIEQGQGMERVQRAAQILNQVGVTGEINFIRYVPKERRLVIPVVKPGVETTIDVDLEARTATVTRRKTTTWETLSYLHRSPGPHNVAIRGNWLWTRVWKWVADATVYLVLFLSMSGIYLWAVLRSERTIGLTLLIAGAVSFAGVIYAVIA
ncbi:MAG TPA: PepSY-associated TM helix domain-containing protein [Bryobacteraceae bacterium]|nr:PepSY-associated TM helix domain-containing protein [Bryobacteraceae bacterium]